ncbi:MAG: YbgC/FadM family acyl-CoA thioesterase [Hyphomonadaceae bacterium]|nr:YbgC/FadM family acyl-CoA thioesterase [Hyphomonadaceae bacterium]
MQDQPSAGRIDGKTHLLPVRVYFEDTDFTGIVYHANYLRFFERGRSDFLRLSGIGHTELLHGPDPTVLAARRLEIEFVKAARIDDALLVSSRFAARQGARLTMAQEIHRGGDLIAAARVEVCCLWPDGRPKRPPSGFMALVAPYLP